MSGLLKLVEILPQTKIESLECAPAPKCLLSCQRPLTRNCPLTVLPPFPRRIGHNSIGDEGASAIAAILNKTMITKLECAAAPECLLSCVNAH